MEPSGFVFSLSARFLLNAIHEFLSLDVFVGLRLFLFRHVRQFPTGRLPWLPCGYSNCTTTNTHRGLES